MQYDIEIYDLTSKGEGVGKYQGEVWFVPKTFPGERVRVEKSHRKKNVQYAHVVEVLQSPRREAPCSAFGVCGGCPIQHMPYTLQVEHKQKSVQKLLSRLGKTSIMHSIVPSSQEFSYRNKLEFSFGYERMTVEWEGDKKIHHDTNPTCGFHKKGSFKEIAHVDQCHLAPQAMHEVFRLVQSTVLAMYEVYNPQTRLGVLRQLSLRENIKGEIMVTLVVTASLSSEVYDVISQHENVIACYEVVSTKYNDDWSSLPYEKKYGEEFKETVQGTSFVLSPQSFFQTNTPTFDAALSQFFPLIESYAPSKIYDLYCGVGTLGILFAKRLGVQNVIGIEVNESAIEMAKINAQNAELNIEYTSLEVEKSDMLQDPIQQNDLLIVDPPRSGLHHRVTEWIRDNGSRMVVYMSCNPATWERDITILSEKYTLTHVLPVDFYPQTPHLEIISVLERAS